MQFFFVYGTLKNGQNNNYLLEDSKYVGQALTKEKYWMWDVGFPYLITEKPVFKDQPKLHVVGDVYHVLNPRVVTSLDALEGVAHGHYKKGLIDVTLNGKLLKCTAYYVEQYERYSSEGNINSFPRGSDLIRNSTYEWGPRQYAA